MEKNSTLKKHADFTVKEKENMESTGLISNNASQPSQTAINNILNYSKALSVLKAKSCGYLEFVLN